MNLNLYGNLLVSSGGSGFLPSALVSKFSFLANVSNGVDVISGNNLTITNKDYTGTAPYTSAATFAMANVAGLKTDDDYDTFWFDGAGTPRQITAAQIIDIDCSRTLVKYANASPYNIEWIGILQKGVSISTDEWNQLHTYFLLHIYWSGVFSDFGFLKDNRALEANTYKAWLLQIIADGGTAPTSTVEAAQNSLVIGLQLTNTLWSRMKTGYFLHCGDTTVGRRNVKAPTTFRTSLGGTLQFLESNGTRSDGSTGYINSTYAANQYVGIETDLTIVSLVSESANPASTAFLYGCRMNGSFHFHALQPKIGGSIGGYTRQEASGNSFVSTQIKALYVDTYDGTNKVIYKDGTKTSTAITPSSPTISAPYLFLSRNASGVNAGITPSTFFIYYTSLILTFNRFNDADELALRTLIGYYKTRAGLPA